MYHHRKFMMSALMCLFLLGGHLLAQAETYTGYMADDLPDARYPVEVEAGQTIHITADATGGDLDPLIALEDPTGYVVDINDDRDTTTISSEIIHVAALSGTYYAIMSNFPGTSGDYSMTVEVLAAEPVVEDRGVETPNSGTEIYTGEILQNKEEDSYPLPLNAGEGVIITAVASEGSNLDTIIWLENSAGTEVAQNDDYEYPTSTNSQIIYVAEQTDTYTLFISHYPGSRGAYEITVEYVSGEEVINSSIVVSDETVDLEPDLVYNGYAGDDVEPQRYVVTLEAGQGLIVNADAVENSTLDTFLLLDGPDGEEVARNDDREPNVTLNSTIVYVAEESGEYTIIMENYPESSGDYVLTVTFINEQEAASIVGNTDRPEINTTPQRVPDQEFTGTIISHEDEDLYPIRLEAGQSLIVSAYATDDAMDPLLIIRDASGQELISNDDRGDYQTYDSQIGFTAPLAGEYTVVVTSLPGAPGNYSLELYYATDEEVIRAQAAMRVLLTGAEQTFDTDNFRIHYTLEGSDATTPEFVQAVANAVEEVFEIQVERLGWSRPPSDFLQGGDARYDVYIINVTDAYGYASSSSPAGDNPNTNILESFSRPAYLVLDNDYSEYDDPIQAMRATTAHEFHHIVQYGYDYSDFKWYYESSASWMETVTFPEQEEATIYVDDVFTYPEICFGAQGEADVTGGSVYGTWLFLEFLQRNYGATAPIILWDNIAVTDGWEPLETTLAGFGETVPNFVALYHINNLVRDYLFVNGFSESSVWLEQTINGIGDWTFTGNGIQELAANYFDFRAPGGIYDITLNAPNTLLEVYAIGIKGADAAVIPLNQGGTINTGNFEHVYLMVFNREYDDNVNECVYTDYSISVQTGTNIPLPATMGFNATNFTPPVQR